MYKIVGIKFKQGGKVYDFDSGAFVLQKGDEVIVETQHGLGYGVVAVPPVTRENQPPERLLKKVFRLANEKDCIRRDKNVEEEKKAHIYGLECIKQLGLKMNLFAVESTFDSGKFTFFFTSDGRVDFRQLVKMLVKKLGVRVEMRQVGIRSQARMCGGLGRCGRVLCCTSFLDKFGPVSIRMAKEQGLSLNPTKISGQCGRLMCCLTYEYETYLKLKKNFPRIGSTVKTVKGDGRVIRHNPINNRVLIRFEDGFDTEINIKDIIIKDITRSKNKPRPPKKKRR
jgi:cell fate regulator YaaT (PSP1 superfamily)